VPYLSTLPSVPVRAPADIAQHRCSRLRLAVRYLVIASLVLHTGCALPSLRSRTASFALGNTADQLLDMTARPRAQFDLVSPYFVPRKGEQRLTGLATNGVRVRVLTNSLESTDTTVVHGGYRKYRKALLRAGVRLYEKERGSHSASSERSEEKHHNYSATGLHAKTFQIDGRSIFVGSFKFDPRSARLNTEMGLLIDNSILANRLSSFFDTQVSSQAYELRLVRADHIEWLESTPQGPRVYEHDPKTSFWRRAKVRMLSILPIDWLL
jgi:cardiolipin synthase C